MGKGIMLLFASLVRLNEMPRNTRHGNVDELGKSKLTALQLEYQVLIFNFGRIQARW